MAFRCTEQLIGHQAIEENSTTQKHPVGTIIKAVDPTYGEGEFIYLVGVASTLVGTVVTYHDGDTLTYQSAFATSAVDDGEPFAVAMSACVAAEYGWYQISGIAVCGKANTLSLAPDVDLAVASGLLIAAATTNRIRGLKSCITASASTLVITVPCMINRPSGPGVG